MILDYRNMGRLEEEYARGMITVDGRRVQQVFYADTEAALVLTYDVLGDGGTYTCFNTNENVKDRLATAKPFINSDGIYYKAINGLVECFRSGDRS